MNSEDLRARRRRLEILVAGLGQEESLWSKCSAPVLAVERQQYMDAIHQALQALESARIALVKIAQRWDKEAAGKTSALG
jgi:hypothetical protein